MNLESTQSNETEQVLVVGAGPVGLWVAAELALAGVPTLVVERAVERSPHSKAMGVHPRTVEVLAMRGVEKEFLAEGGRVPTWHFGMLDNRLDLRELDTPYPFLLSIPQLRTEQLFERRALDLGVRILRGHGVTGLTQDDSAVTVELDGPDGPYALTARYVVGADGAGSTVRKAAGVDFPGSDATTFGYVGEVVLDDPPVPPVISAHNTDGALITVPLGGGRFRIAGLDSVRQGRDDGFTFEDLRATTTRVAGSDFGMRDPGWLSRFGNTTRIAATYRKGRVLLAGDAAHMHFPAGGVGLNVGVQDAMNLGWKLAAQVQGRAAPGLLDSYHDERHPVGLELAEHTLAQTALIGAATPEQRELRKLVNDLVGSVPQLNRALADKLSGLDVAYPGTHPLVGKRFPAAAEHLHRGRPVLLTDLEEAADLAARLGFETAGGPGAVVVRPDGHVWWAADEADTEADVLAGLTALGTTF
ncbi:FAD-dependent monooxygenase [Umezawaea tangerina]|uniref:2-polyprenyl-6-methoxyphenol hydroxylase-like FAD-dependent oxidoreductase n=1 Tax=Umezawaea tangerina TaxID=84725 RepID=A0A2T0SZ78_9PSEU|nr:FAD-dependent monooxygenase [Umezawaea tangerina]PRY38721.1 2-polyprenyl-6-methoxyphenol hydroxylase-like FAD-dependent oxidoreductase [Umezawaea tangerina]